MSGKAGQAPAAKKASISADDYSVVTIDRSNGEVVWSETGLTSCGINGVFCTGEVSWEDVEDNSAYQLKVGAVTLHGKDFATGEETWAYEVAALSGSDSLTDGALVNPPGFAVFADSGVNVLLDVRTGVASEITDDMYIGCTVSTPFMAPEFSNPSRELVEFTGSISLAACAAGEIFTDPATFTELVVMSGTQSYLLPGEERSDDDKFYIVQTADKVLAYQL